MIWNLWHRCIYPLRCRFWDKDRMADAPVILLSSKAEVCAQPISPFPSRLHGGLPAAPGGDNGGGGRVDGVDAVVHGPHLARALHRVSPPKKRDRSAADERRSRRPRSSGSGGSPLRPDQRRGTPPRPDERRSSLLPPASRDQAASCCGGGMDRRDRGGGGAGSERDGGGEEEGVGDWRGLDSPLMITE